MTAIITWKIERLDYEVVDGAVTQAHWRVLAEQDNELATAYGSVGFNPDPEDPDFVPLEQLTEEIVLEWVKAQLDVEAIEGGLQGELNSKINPTVVSGLPWATLPEE
mgnify:CR=1 FL=1